MASTVLRESRGPTLLLTLNRPNALNAVNSALRDELIAACAAANADDEVRAVVITGAGRAFCAGQDLAEAAGFSIEEVPAWLDHQRAMYQAVRDLTKPCVAALNGTAAGAGLQIGLCSDVRVGFPEGKLAQPEVRAGLASIVGSYLLSLHVGLAHNVEMSLGGGLIAGERAYALGLLNHLVPQDRVLEQALAVAAELGTVSSPAMRMTKRHFRNMTQAGFDRACAAGIRAQLEAYATGEPQRIMRGFLAKRTRGSSS